MMSQDLSAKVLLWLGKTLGRNKIKSSGNFSMQNLESAQSEIKHSTPQLPESSELISIPTAVVLLCTAENPTNPGENACHCPDLSHTNP